MKNRPISFEVTVFNAKIAPETANLVGYGAMIQSLELALPFPNQMSLVSKQRKNFENEDWKVYESRNSFEDTLYKHLVFALKYEGINLLFFKKLFDTLSKAEITDLVQIESTGIYSRKIWYLYEWLKQEKLDIPDLVIKNSIPLVDEKLQYASPNSINSPRHKIKNNLLGNVDFCPMIFKTKKLENYIEANLSQKNKTNLNAIQKEVLLRASAFLLLKDSKASFSIEGETPSTNRATRWGNAIGQAGKNELNQAELERLQQIVIENSKFTKYGFRTQQGFIGEHDRETFSPIPDHISAKWQDIDQLMNGLFETVKNLKKSQFDPILSATIIAFGFVFIHPFVDGNGRLHRYLIHHILSSMNFAQQGMIFPVSASILSHIENYRNVLEAYSHPILNFINWKKTVDNNIEILNETIDYYRYFDATKQAEFLFDSVNDTIENVIPEEVNYLIKYDEMKRYLDDVFQMPDKTVALLIRFLDQNKGVFTKRAREYEFKDLEEKEIEEIEKIYQKIFL